MEYFPSTDKRQEFQERPFLLPSGAASAMSLSFTTSNIGNNSQGNSSSYCSSHFIQTTHAQIRRKQRNILYKDVKAAIKFGVRAPHIWSSDLKRLRQQKRKKGHSNISLPPRHSVYKYTYKDLVYIVDEKERKEITCYTKPVELQPMPIPPSITTHQVGVDAVAVLSHTIMIIDTSGSMNTSDVWGTRNRLDAVWMAIAIDFIAVRLQEQDRTGRMDGSDIVTMILMKEQAQVLYRCVPITWILYNQFVHIYNQRQTIPPSGHGFFLPSLAIAEQIIDECNSLGQSNFNTSSTVTSLLLLSDGVPSDPKKNRQQIMDHIHSITTKQVAIANPFLFTAIGIGGGIDGKGKNDSNNNNNGTNTNTKPNQYPVLRQMVQTAQNSGATSAQLKVPSMSCTSFGQTFSSVATSISTSMTLQSSSLSSPQQNGNSLRGGFRTISIRDDGDDDEDNDDNVHPQLMIDHRDNRIVPRETKTKAMEMIHEVTAEDFNIYPVYGITRKICHIPDNLDMKFSTFVSVPLQHPDTRYVAVAKGAFDEGNERYVYRLFEVAYDGKTILGLPMVAKESRRTPTSTTNQTSNEDDYVHTFCKTQQLARQLAVHFNRRLCGNPQQILIDTPRVSFLDCSVYELFDPQSGRRFNVLVENMIDHTQWCKWNSNNGWRMNHGRPLLEQINEADEEDMIDENENENDIMVSVFGGSNSQQPKPFTPSQVAQSFSHFTHWLTNGMHLVCDLQGIYDEERNILQLSDPVIHSNTNRTHRLFDQQVYSDANRRRNQFGRTDRGDRGIDDFFMTHCCDDQNHLCQFVTGCEFQGSLSYASLIL